MKALFAALLLVSVSLLRASDLTLRFTSGWAPHYHLSINFETGDVVYTEDKAGVPHLYKLPDSKKAGLYVKALMEKIPQGRPIGAFGDDGAVYSITFTDGKSARQFTIGNLGLDERTMSKGKNPTEKELKEDKIFTEDIRCWYLCRLLDQIVETAKRGKPF